MEQRLCPQHRERSKAMHIRSPQKTSRRVWALDRRRYDDAVESPSVRVARHSMLLDGDGQATGHEYRGPPKPPKLSMAGWRRPDDSISCSSRVPASAGVSPAPAMPRLTNSSPTQVTKSMGGERVWAVAPEASVSSTQAAWCPSTGDGGFVLRTHSLFATFTRDCFHGISPLYQPVGYVRQ